MQNYTEYINLTFYDDALTNWHTLNEGAIGIALPWCLKQPTDTIGE